MAAPRGSAPRQRHATRARRRPQRTAKARGCQAGAAPARAHHAAASPTAQALRPGAPCLDASERETPVPGVAYSARGGQVSVGGAGPQCLKGQLRWHARLLPPPFDALLCARAAEHDTVTPPSVCITFFIVRRRGRQASRRCTRRRTTLLLRRLCHNRCTCPRLRSAHLLRLRLLRRLRTRRRTGRTLRSTPRPGRMVSQNSLSQPKHGQ